MLLIFVHQDIYVVNKDISHLSASIFCQSNPPVGAKNKFDIKGQSLMWLGLLFFVLSSPLAPFFVHFMSAFLASRAMHFMSPLCTFCHLFIAGERLAKALSDKAYCCSPWWGGTLCLSNIVHTGIITFYCLNEDKETFCVNENISEPM